MNKYPKRGGDCEHTMDCMWGTDGWCDRPRDYKCVLDKTDQEKTRQAEINEYMETRTQEETCPCGGELKQSRSGSFRAKCQKCGKLWQLGGRRRE